MGLTSNNDRAVEAVKHPRYMEFREMVRAKAMMFDLNLALDIGYASNTFIMDGVRVDIDTMEPLKQREWDRRVTTNYGADVFFAWLEANPVTSKGNGDE